MTHCSQDLFEPIDKYHHLKQKLFMVFKKADKLASILYPESVKIKSPLCILIYMYIQLRLFISVYCVYRYILFHNKFYKI